MVIKKLKNKRILITAGPTWVPIDSVRVISNVATGETGILLAEKLNAIGAKVTFLLGPAAGVPVINKGIRTIRFRFFDELKKVLIKELSSGKYDIVIHSAAVSDYRPMEKYGAKVSSNKNSWKIRLAPTEKLIDTVKKIDDSLFLGRA